jgi:hypothetical protein
MKTQNAELQEVMLQIIANYTNLNKEQIEKLIFATSKISGCSMVGIADYSSDKSNNTEVARHLINIGASYENMLKKDNDIFNKLNAENVVELIDVTNDKDYFNVNLDGVLLADFKQMVKDSLPIALAELQQPKNKKNTSNDFWLNSALVFNINTMRLSIFGQRVNKTIEVKGTFNPVKSAPKTIAKRLIEKQSKGKSQMLGRFALDNLIGQINISKEVIEIG